MTVWKEPKLVYRRGRRPKGLVIKNRKLNQSSFEYNSFPQTIHGRAVLSYDTESINVQKVLTKVLKELNGLQLDTSISVADREGYFTGRIVFEVGVANRDYFICLDRLEERLINRIMAEQGILATIDFLILARYSIQDQKKHPIRMDSYLVRTIASEYSMELYLSHEKGIRRLNPDELIMMIARGLDRELKASYNASVKVESLRTA